MKTLVEPGIQKTRWGAWEYGFLGDNALQGMADKVKAHLNANHSSGSIGSLSKWGV